MFMIFVLFDILILVQSLLYFDCPSFLNSLKYFLYLIYCLVDFFLDAFT